jgi:hypothetical protein
VQKQNGIARFARYPGCACYRSTGIGGHHA